MAGKGNIANLRPIKKGEVRNPKGRPKQKWPLLDELMSDLANENRNGIPRIVRVLTKLWDKAEQGDNAAIKEIILRMYGAVTQVQTIEHSGQIKGNDVDLSKFTPEEIEELVKLSKKLDD